MRADISLLIEGGTALHRGRVLLSIRPDDAKIMAGELRGILLSQPGWPSSPHPLLLNALADLLASATPYEAFSSAKEAS